MRDLTLIIAFVFGGLLCSQVQAQNYQLGLRFNPNLGWMAPDVSGLTDHSVENDGVRFGFSWGVMGDFHFADNYSFAKEIRVTTLNGGIRYRNRADGNDYYEDFDFGMQFIDIPLALKLRTNEIGYFTFFGKFGLVPGVAINRDAEFSTNNTDEDGESIPDMDLDMSDDISFFRAAVEVSLGSHYRIAGSTAVKASLGYNIGLFDQIQNNPDHRTFDRLNDGDGKFELRSRYITLNIGLIF